MQLFKHAGTFAAIALLAALTGCNSSTSSNPLSPILGGGPGPNSAQLRFVNGSPDAGPVQIFIDNQQQFCASGSSGSACAVSYGQITSYMVNVSAGQHAIVLKGSSGTTIAIPTGSLSVNGGQRYSIVLTGELHPTYTTTPNLGITTFLDQPYNTPSGGAAVNIHYASPYEASVSPAPLQFGYFINNNVSLTTTLGSTVSFGSETTPQGIASSGLNVPITFYAGTPAGPTITPAQVDSTNCASNALPCSTGNLSLYLIDGPTASISPTGTPPAAISPSAKAGFTGVFD
jgi:hypothetical protein